MVSFTHFLIVTSILSLKGLTNDFSFPLAKHREQIVKAVDVSVAKQCWDEEQWGAVSIFFDFDGDDRDEALTSTTSQSDACGNAWSVWTTGIDGRLFPLEVSPDTQSNFTFTCHEWSFYFLQKAQGRAQFVGLGMDAGIMNAERSGFVSKMPDCIFSKDKSGELKVDELLPSLDWQFRTGGMVKIERLYGEKYKGFDFEPSQREYWFNFRRPKGDLRPGGGVAEPAGFTAFADGYRRDVKARTGAEKGGSVFAVFLDADNDGDADCYVSSDAEGDKDGKYSWTLYMNRDGVLGRAAEPIFPVAARRELCELPPSVVAATNGFCRVVRFDVNPFFVILDGKGSSTKVRDAITHHLAHRIEKLPCTEFKEVATAAEVPDEADAG